MSKIVVTIAGDSGDGVQLLGNSFTENLALENYDLNTLPDFPAEIRAPAGTVHGVSGFQIQYGSERINTAGQKSDVFIAFNAAALKKYFKTLKTNGVLIYDPSGFDAKNCKLANFDVNELESITQKKLAVEFSKMTKESLSEYDLTDKERDKNKNLFALGILAFAIDSSIEKTNALIRSKFKGEKLHQMEIVLSKGFHYAETIEFSIDKLESKTSFKEGFYKNITGNKAISLAILAAPKRFGRPVFFGGYPITPASEILHELAKYNFKELIVRQAEDEIAAASMALGAAFGGSIGVTASSGPGIDLKQEVIGLAHMAEIPLLIIDVQRAGPSTGLPTKIEQSDLSLVLDGRHGDCPVPVVAIKSPSTAFDTTMKAIEMMIKYQTPIFLLSDALIANGSELWKIPEIEFGSLDEKNNLEPYDRSDNLVRPWTDLGKEGIQYIAGGLEKDYKSGAISYEGDNHEKMVKTRLQKIINIENELEECTLEKGSIGHETLIVSWGSTYGSVLEAFEQLVAENRPVAHLHLEWIFPLPKNFKSLIDQFDQLIVPELNQGQLADYLARFYKKTIYKINKTKGVPFFENELKEEIENILNR